MKMQPACHFPAARRTTIRLLAAALFLAGAGGAAASEEPHASVSPDAALERLLDGNERFASGSPSQAARDPARRAELATTQRPFAVVVGCSDSRVGPEVVFDQGLGELFVIRTAGEVEDDVGIGSIEYAAEHLGVALILVLGHERCGAVSAAVAGGEAHGHLPALLEPIQPAVDSVRDRPGDLVDNAVRAQARAVADQLRRSEPVLADLVKSGKLRIVAARYDLDTGRVELLD